MLASVHAARQLVLAVDDATRRHLALGSTTQWKNGAAAVYRSLNWIEGNYMRSSRAEQNALDGLVVVGAMALGGALVVGARAMRLHYHTASEIPDAAFRARRVLHGVVTSVGDGDNFRVRHISTARRLFFFAMSPRSAAKSIGEKRSSEKSSETTIHVRLAGVDAPECAHFGQPGQAYGPEARAWLAAYLDRRRVRFQLLRRDQYGRAVAMVWVRRGLSLLPFPFSWWANVSEQLALAGFATLYIGNEAEYGGLRARLQRAEQLARRKRRGMWAAAERERQSPMEYKRQQRAGAS